MRHERPFSCGGPCYLCGLVRLAMAIFGALARGDALVDFGLVSACLLGGEDRGHRCFEMARPQIPNQRMMLGWTDSGNGSEGMPLATTKSM